MATTGRSPPIAMPAAPVTACCSAMPTSKKRSGKRAWNGSRPVGPGHRRGDRDDAVVGLGLLDDRLGERLRVAGGHRLGRTDQRVEDRGVVEVLLVVVLGRRVAAALLGEDVDDDRALGRQLDGVAERLLERRDVVAVDRADVAHAEGLEERRRLQELAHRGLERLDAPSRPGVPTTGRSRSSSSSRRWRRTYIGLRRMLGERLRQPVADAADQAGVGRIGHRLRVGDGGEVGDRRGVAAAVVVEHDDDASPAVAEVVQRLVGHAAGHRAVADDGDDVAVRVAPGVAGDGQPVGVGQDRGGVAVLDEVVRGSPRGTGSRTGRRPGAARRTRPARPVTILCT